MTLSPRSLRRNESLQEQVYWTLRTAILSGEIAPGERLVETHLARNLQVSRTPIREALGQLQQEELVVVDAENVLRVVKISLTDAAQLYDCRIALEQLSVKEACDRATESQLQSLKEMVEQTEKLVNSKPSQLTNFQLLDLDYCFHRLLAESSGNLWLRSLLDRVFDQMLLLRLQTIQHNRNVLEIRTEHCRIYEAVARRDPEAAALAIHEHLVASKERVIREIDMSENQHSSPCRAKRQVLTLDRYNEIIGISNISDRNGQKNDR